MPTSVMFAIKYIDRTPAMEMNEKSEKEPLTCCKPNNKQTNTPTTIKIMVGKYFVLHLVVCIFYPLIVMPAVGLGTLGIHYVNHKQEPCPKRGLSVFL
jgi:hypothetical protein